MISTETNTAPLYYFVSNQFQVTDYDLVNAITKELLSDNHYVSTFLLVIPGMNIRPEIVIDAQAHILMSDHERMVNVEVASDLENPSVLIAITSIKQHLQATVKALVSYYDHLSGRVEPYDIVTNKIGMAGNLMKLYKEHPDGKVKIDIEEVGNYYVTYEAFETYGRAMMKFDIEPIKEAVTEDDKDKEANEMSEIASHISIEVDYVNDILEYTRPPLETPASYYASGSLYTVLCSNNSPMSKQVLDVFGKIRDIPNDIGIKVILVRKIIADNLTQRSTIICTCSNGQYSFHKEDLSILNNAELQALQCMLPVM